MEIRVLNYFLMVAREENITRASALLHLSQPTLSRQMMQLEEELGVKLFSRHKHSIVLTDEGMLLKRRAEEIVSLAEETQREFKRQEAVSGVISIGSGEARSVQFLTELISSFKEKYPLVQYDIYSAAADDIQYRIEKGLLDIGFLLEPVDIGRYEYLRVPQKERWGVLVHTDWDLAKKDTVSPKELSGIPVLMSKRQGVKTELAGWFGEYYHKLEVVSTYNLIYNAAIIARAKLGAAITMDHGNLYENLRFVPFSPPIETGCVLVWKKHQSLSKASALFLEEAKECLKRIS